ncbi:adenylate/guanylate cyclase domain-containing protein [Lusitaniella coriacea LEGE 07157]|uniref:Adenylate/guanylate cyclase domain-containing protein n=1 Tax=Lusitaniella coriacea LEGE 07157 TaxID=945747 RepID=A0A8J7DVM8_9CYAN|nr:adenylate/guanylate cyclase domain-containing protein [Lusitaniella coriacea]MBE9115586.1 adenylate/guanylate cyclase domain-containing protein [Lusitaniella coriacea LEGE 07157]
MRVKQLKHKIREWRGVGFVIPTIAGIITAIRFLGFLQPLELVAFDRFMSWRPTEAIDERIIIVGVEEEDLKGVGQWPIPDAVLARAIEKIKAENPAVIGLDFYRDLPVEPGRDDLVRVLKDTPNLIGIELFGDEQPNSAVAPPPTLKDQPERIGFNNVVIDSDGKLRRGLLSSYNGEREAASLSMILAGMYLENLGIIPQPLAKNSQAFSWGKGIVRPLQKYDGGYAGVDTGGYQVLINYRGSAGRFLRVSLMDVLEDKIPDRAKQISSGSAFEGRIVLIGATAVSLNDFFYTPYSGNHITTPERTPGVEVHANITSQLLALALDGRPLIQTLPKPAEILLIFIGSSVGAIACWLSREGGKLNATPLHWILVNASLTGSALVAFIGGSYLCFAIASWWLPVVPCTLALLASTLALNLYIAQIERQERQTLMTLFGRHVTPKIAEEIWLGRDRLLKEGRLKGRKAIASVLFSDLKGFSTIATLSDPEELMCWLNEYMDGMAKEVLQHGGVVDKFIGDAVMGVFGVPIPRQHREEIANDAIAAVQCALAMTTTLEALNQQWEIQGRPQTSMRIGIATGEVVTGSLGSSQRIDYTTLGDSVNVAARLEGYDKTFDGGLCRILINEETYQLVKEKFPTKFVKEVILKGRQQKTKIYQVLRL